VRVCEVYIQTAQLHGIALLIDDIGLIQNGHTATTNRFRESKVLPEHKTHGAALISVSLALMGDTSLHYETFGYASSVGYRAVCPFTPQLSLVLFEPTHGGMARLS